MLHETLFTVLCCVLLYSTLLYSTLLYSTLFHSTYLLSFLTSSKSVYQYST